MFVYFVLTLIFFSLALAGTAAAKEAKYAPIIKEAALEYNIDPDLALAIAEVESQFNPQAVGGLGEIGMFQLRPEFHNVIKNNPRHNARVAMAYLNYVRRVCTPKYGSAFWVCYNVGPYRPKIQTPEKLPYYKKVKSAYKARKAKSAYVGR